jgi:hypothetical protein
MAPKKKSSKKEGGGTDPEAEAQREKDLPELPVYVQRFVMVHFKLVTWEYLNFSMHLPTNTRLFAVSEIIQEHHGGSIYDLAMYKYQVHPRNLLSDLAKTLEESGIEGGLPEEKVECIIWYDFQLSGNGCPLLLSSPRLLRTDKMSPEVYMRSSSRARAPSSLRVQTPSNLDSAHRSPSPVLRSPSRKDSFPL